MELKNWKLIGGFSDSTFVVGEVYGNPEFDDGTTIRTSTVQNIYPIYQDTNDGIMELIGYSIVTQNHEYLAYFSTKGILPIP